MAQENASSTISCPQWYLDAARILYTITCQVISPAYFVFGISLHAITLMAYCTEVKKEKGYLYQIFLTISRILTAIFPPLYTFGITLVRSNSPGTMWFRSSYWLMWTSINFFLFCTSVSYFVTHLFSLLVSVDRVYALWKPISYQVTHVKRNNALIVFILAMISIAVSISTIFKFNVVQANSTSDFVVYESVPNFEFVSSNLGRVLVNLPSVLQWPILIGLCSCNVGAVWLYRKSRLKAKQFLNKTSEMKKREAIEKLLTLLAISQSTCFTISISYSSFTTLLATYPSYYLCGMNLHTVLLMSALMLFDLLDFAFVFVVNKRFRRMILKTVKCRSKSNVDTAPVVNQGMAGQWVEPE